MVEEEELKYVEAVLAAGLKRLLETITCM